MAKGKRPVEKKTTLSFIIDNNDISHGEDLLSFLMKMPIHKIEYGSPEGKPVRSFSIDNITLDGFGPHGGPNTLELNNGLTLLTGENGTGKTHLLLAVHWCLFGERGSLDPWLSEADPLGKDLVNWSRIADNDYRMSVEVNFEWDGHRYCATRRLMDGIEDFSMTDSNGSLETENVSPIGLTPDILPYLIFQGEAVMFLASEDTFLKEGNLKELIRSLSGTVDLDRNIKIMEETRSLLFERSRNLQKIAGPKERELESLEERIRTLNEDITDLETRIIDLSDEKKRALAQYRRSLKELSRIGVITGEEEKRAMAKARAPILHERFEDMLSGADREILRKMAEKALSRCLDEKEERIKKRMMYGALESQTSIIRKISKTGKCLCGTSIGRTGMGRENIKALLLRFESRRDELKEIDGEPIWTSDQLHEGVRKCLASPDFNRDHYLETVKEMERTNTILQKTRARMKTEGMDGFISNVREYERTTVLLDREKDDLVKLKLEKKSLKKEIKRSERELLRIWGVEEGSEGLSTRAEILEKNIIEHTTKARKLMDGMRNDIENRSNITLRKLDPEGRLGDIRIHPRTYRLGREIEMKEGSRTVPMAYLSAGEREVLALSVLSSIPTISEGILMLDSPFPYVDSTRRNRIIEGLPRISKRVFISLPEGTMTDEELENAKSMWIEKGSSFYHYRLKMRKGGTVLINTGGGDK